MGYGAAFILKTGLPCPGGRRGCMIESLPRRGRWPSSARGRMRRDCTAITRVRAAAARFASSVRCADSFPRWGSLMKKRPLRSASLFLLIHSLIILPVLLGRKARSIFKDAAEMRRRHKAGLFRNVRDALVRLLNEVLRGLDAHAVDILDEREVDGLLEKAAQIIRADIELTGDAGQGQLVGVVLGDIGWI